MLKGNSAGGQLVKVVLWHPAVTWALLLSSGIRLPGWKVKQHHMEETRRMLLGIWVRLLAKEKKKPQKKGKGGISCG